jgi:hypothetical protein
MDIKIAERKAWKIVKNYLNIRVYEKKICAPYFINDVGMYFGKLLRDTGINTERIKLVFDIYNNRGIPYGWYRGKGSPKQIEQSVLEIAEIKNVDLNTSSSEGVREFMRSVGLGVDCSGFVYNTLAVAVGEERLIDGLDWFSQERNIYKAGARSFSGFGFKKILPNQVRSLDIIYLENPEPHVALVLMGHGKLWTVQSTSRIIPPGVAVDELRIENKKPVFCFKPYVGRSWEELYDIGKLRFARLGEIEE